MRIHFYKLHLGGNSFILIDTEAEKEIKPLIFASVSKTLCNKRYGIGASGCIFLDDKNNLQVFNPNGIEQTEFTDALFCAARYAFDSGKLIKNSKDELTIQFNTLKQTQELKVISNREFVYNIGCPFTLASGKIITQQSGNCLEEIKIDDKILKMSGIHILADNLVTSPKNTDGKTFFQLYIRLREIFNKQKIFLTFSQSITRETICIRTIKRGLNSSCSSAAASLVTSVLAGSTNPAAVCVFTQGNKSLLEQQNLLINDIDDSKKITVLWDTKDNSLKLIASGGYLYEGFFDFRMEK